MFYVKTILGSDIRRFALALPDFAVLESVLQATYGKPGVQFTVRYEDDDGDIISVSSNAELEEAVKCRAPKTLVFRVAPVDAPQSPTGGQSDCEIISLPSSPCLPPETGEWNICDDLESNEPQTESSLQQETEQKAESTPVEVVGLRRPLAEEITEALATAKQHRKAIKFAKKAAKKKHDKKEQPQPPVCSNKPVVHSNVRCDSCQAFPVVGDRYKCTVCDDYDLCAACEAQGSHSANHPFVKFKMPEVTRHAGVQCDDCREYPITGDRFKCLVCPQYDLCEKCEAKRMHDVTHPLVKLRVEMSTLTPALIAAASVADSERPKVHEVSEAEIKESEGKDAERKARRAEKKEARRKEKEAKKAERKAQKEGDVPQVQKVAEQPVSPVASAFVDNKEAEVSPVPEPIPQPQPVPQPAEPAIPLAMPVAESLLAPELEEKLQILEALGFTDRQHMCLLLSRFNGDLQRVADALLFV